MSSFLTQPRLEILPPAQKEVWKHLHQIPKKFTLYGGTALALYLGHRESIDFDFFSFESFDVDQLQMTLPLLKGAEVLQKEKDTLTCLVNMGEKVQLSFFGLPHLQSVFSPLQVQENQIFIASLLDIGGMKVSVVQKRAEYKDYFDIYSMISQLPISLDAMLSAAKNIYQKSFNPQITLKALSFFNDGDLNRLSETQKNQLINAVLKVNLNQLPSTEQMFQQLQLINQRFI